MKLNPTLAAGLFAMLAALPFSAGAAPGTPVGTTIAADAAANAEAGAKNATDGSAGAKADNAAHPMKMRPHSHVEEKTGVVQRMPEAVPDRPNPARDFSKHFHPRDGK